MAWTKETYLQRTREWMDAVGSDRWSDAFLYALLDKAYRDETQGILNASPYFKFAQRTVTTDSNGQFSFSGLSSGSGDNQQNVYRIITVTDGQNTLYRETEFRNVPLAVSGTTDYLGFDRQYYLIGDNVQILPQTSGLSLQVSINYIGTPIDELSPLGTADFPPGHENLLALSAAANALAIGGSEFKQTQELSSLAQQFRTALYEDVARRTSNPMTLTFPDRAAVWGG